MRRVAATLALSALLCVLPACGGGGEAEGEGGDNAVEARETNAFTLGDLRYRVVMFRQLNPSTAPDKALYDGGPLDGRRELFAAFLTVCNETGEVRAPTSDIELEDAFGKVYPQVDVAAGNPLAYEAEPIAADACFPEEDAVAERSLPGAATLFEVPVDALSNRPFVLELTGDGGDVERVQLDL